MTKSNDFKFKANIFQKYKNIFSKSFTLVLILLVIFGTLSSTTVCFGKDGHIRFEIIKLSHFIQEIHFSFKDPSSGNYSIAENFCEYCNDIPFFTHNLDIFHIINSKPILKLSTDKSSIFYSSLLYNRNNYLYIYKNFFLTNLQYFFHTNSFVVLII